ncbi:phage tail protein [Providencia sp. PROV077]|uniref:phage tail protein n=3 Tax=unclassified Providencia TaxID=2633465 RepID=UPI00234B5637|nr:phage tail protein [Providencia sp. PROV077]
MKYFALLTKLGENLLAQATALGTKLELTHMAVGDGGGSLPTPDTNQTKLIAEKRRAAINTLFIDDKNKNQIIAEQIIPEQDGGWWIREIGLFDKAGNLIAVANCPETYKPQLAEGSGRTQSIRMVLVVSHTESVTLKIDPSVVLATREYVNTEITVLDKKIDALSAQTKLDLNKKFDKANISGQKGNDNDKVPSLNLFTTETDKLAAIGYSYSKIESDGRYQPKGNYAPAGDYATNTALNNGLNQKLNISGGRATGAIFASSFTVYYSGIKNIMNLYSPQTEEDLAYFQYSNDKGWLGRLEIPRLESGKGQLISTIDLEQGTNTSSITVYKSGSSYPMLRLKRSDGAVVYIEAKPDEKASLAQLYRRNTAGQIEYNISFPKRTGTVAIEGDSYKKNESDALMLGINQKWTDVKSQRSKGTTYTNTTGKPIVVMLSALITGGGSGINSTMTIDDVDFVFKSGGQDGSSGNTWKGSAISIIIPTNSKYKFESMGNIESWLELRA